MISLVRFYQRWISPAFPARCKYYPTCSDYALQAIRKHGVLIGSALALWRLVRCNPWSMGGIDYPPTDRHILRKASK
ncbi:MAG: membrane protein insertion efficiency factor YidD [Actinomycetota bacterium]